MPKAIKIEGKGFAKPSQFYIYGLVPGFGMFEGPTIVTANPGGQAHTSSFEGTLENFKACGANSINMH